ncbi:MULTISPECIES: terminase TerL endonuclease subunit [Rhodopseudomonas]|uniref:Terminase n=1 Tax=Rhodopseudomonas palustris TaxID=1076 RepID=A0A0D7EKV2_RHOPL|nr:MULTISPECIES: terminase TerL endonuclease subunit [Rhodopseudomonas]KIZ41433.1 terminase [Rhodopseudomonas palustris]MDF3810064.1 terminase large subunit [Rhodopseudomonas sp. BAL398]WOK18741.1 terminase large subunit [Rhodopseudomonas sp. BAL398]
MSGPAWISDASPIPDPLGRGQRAVDFLRLLKHPKSRLPGKAFQLDPPFERIVRAIYGPTDAHGARLVRVVYLQVGKGSRKTSLAAALALLHTYGPERLPRGANYVAAADKGQARVAFEEALGIVEAIPQLAGASRPVDSKNRLIHPKSGSFFEALSSDGRNAHARTPMFILVDELWAHRKADLWQALRTGATKAPGSLLIVATTAGRGNESPDYPIYEYAKKVQAGEIIDPSFLPIIFEADPADAWDSEETWSKVLPGLPYGYPDLPSMRQYAREAKERPADRAAFEQFYLGRRQENSLSPFVDMAVFDEGKATIDVEALAGRECWIAGDMSSTTDLSAVLACFPDGDDFIVLCWAFVPADNLQARADRDGVPYPRWAKEGWIIPTPGGVIDYRLIESHIRNLCEKYEAREIAFDPAYATPVLAPLTDDGYPTLTMRQGWVTQSPALNIVERAVIGRNLKWNSPVLRWCVENVAIHTDSAGNRVMHKGKSRDRIDLAVTLWMALVRASAGDSNVSIYSTDERPDGLLTI